MLSIVAKQKTKVAIIDDDVELTDELSHILTDVGYQVEVFDSPRFINHFIAHRPDVMLIDVWFDGVAEGLNETKAINYQKKLNHTPVILMSSDTKIAEYAKTVGATKYMLKPIDPEELLTTLRSVLHP